MIQDKYYSPVGFLAKEGNQEAVAFLIDQFNANINHAVFCATWGRQLDLLDFLLNREKNTEAKKNLFLFIEKGFKRSLWDEDNDINSLSTFKNQIVNHPSEQIRELTHFFHSILKTMEEWTEEESYLLNLTNILPINYFQSEDWVRSNKDRMNKLGDRSTILGLFISKYQLDYEQAKCLLTLTQGVRLWLLQGLRQLITRQYIDIKDNEYKDCENNSKTLPTEIWVYITELALGVNKLEDLRKIFIAINKKLCDQIIVETQSKHSSFSTCPEIISNALSFFGFHELSNKKKQIKALNLIEEERYQKRISFEPISAGMIE